VVDRLAALRELLADDPDDPFTRYALAMELKGRGDPAGARAELEALLTRAPEYLATYYQLASLLHAEGDSGRAADVIRRGIELAGEAGDAHTAGELEDLLDDVTG